MRLPVGARWQRWLGAGVAFVATVLAAACAAAAVLSPRPWLVFLAVLGSTIAVVFSTAVVSGGLIARSEHRTLRRIDRVEAAVESTRAKASRHEYHQEQSLDRIERTTLHVAATADGLAWFGARSQPRRVSPAVPRVLFVTSNGGGMGHIARCSAIIRHSRGQLTGRILTLSTAAATVRDAGFPVDYFPSLSAMGGGKDRWRRQFARRLLTDLAENPVDAIAFDGTWVFPSLTDVAEYADVPLVWIRRGLWREGSDLAQVEAWREHVGGVVVPADIAESRDSAPEPFRDATWTDPISLASEHGESRENALVTLGLDPSRKYALVQLSGGNTDGSATIAAVEAIRGTGDIVPVVVRSPLLPRSVVAETTTIEGTFPLVDFSAAWDFTVTGAGYNSVHENLHTSTPGVYLPSTTTLMDDQEKRARAVADAGLGLVADGAEGLGRAIADIVVQSRAEDLREAMRERNVPQGAPRAALAITEVLDAA